VADDTYAAYLAHRATGLAIPKNTHDSGLKVLWGDKVRAMSAGNINAATIADLRAGYTGTTGTLAEKEKFWLASRGAPAGTIADMRVYSVLNALMP